MVDFQTIIPYKPGNLGASYNEAMQKIDNWVLFLDHDILLLRPEWYSMCQHAIEQHPDAGWISGVTNRIWCTGQKKPPEKDHDDISGHIRHSNELYKHYGNTVLEYTGSRPFSGFFILTNKGVWQDVGGFKDGFMGVDNFFYNALKKKGYKCYTMPGLYCFHIYDKKKLFETKQSVKKISAPTKIGVSMIMRNEARYLPRCLESIQSLADEIVIMDTGSTDDSIKIAESYGARIIIPENFDDFFLDTKFGPKLNFSAARNECLKHMSPDITWILQIDCDEELIFDSDKLEVAEFLDSFDSSVNGLTVDMLNMSSGQADCKFITPRIFRAGYVEYKNIIHNRPDIEGGRWGFINQDRPRITLKHFGYDISEEERKEKNERTIGLLHKRIEMDPDDYEAYFYLSQSYGWGVDDEKCIQYAIDYVSHRDKILAKDLSFNDAVFYTLAGKLITLKRYKEAGEWIKRGLELDKENLDLFYAMVRLGLEIKEVKLIIHGAEGFLKTYGDYERIRLTKGTRFVYTYNPASYTFCTLHLTLALFQQGAFLKHQFEEILKELPEDDAKKFNAAFVQGLEIIGFQEKVAD